MRRLVLDIGNTRTSAGIFCDGTQEFHWRITTRHWTADDLWAILWTLLRAGGSPLPGSVAYACVVPQVRHSLRELATRYIGVEPVEVTAETAGVRIEYDFPAELGADRLANAAGVLKLGRPPAIIVDFGTATTFDVLDAQGAYRGGVIAPGIGTAAAELFRKAEKLNPVDLRFPDSVLGRSTSEAIRSGVLLGAVGAADHIVSLLAEGIDGEPEVWATGGWAPGLAERCAAGMRVCPELTLTGVDAIGEVYENEEC